MKPPPVLRRGGSMLLRTLLAARERLRCWDPLACRKRLAGREAGLGDAGL